MNRPLEEQAWLVGFLINPEAETPEVYTLILPGEVDQPLSEGGYLLFFRDPASAAQFLNGRRHLTGEVDAVYNLAMVLYLLAHKNCDTTAIIVDSLNILFDLVTAIKITMPIKYKEPLYCLADHLTFNQEFASFLNEQNISRTIIIDGLIWCLGAIVSQSKVVG